MVLHCKMCGKFLGSGFCGQRCDKEFQKGKTKYNLEVLTRRGEGDEKVCYRAIERRENAAAALKQKKRDDAIARGLRKEKERLEKEEKQAELDAARAMGLVVDDPTGGSSRTTSRNTSRTRRASAAPAGAKRSASAAPKIARTSARGVTAEAVKDFSFDDPHVLTVHKGDVFEVYGAKEPKWLKVKRVSTHGEEPDGGTGRREKGMVPSKVFGADLGQELLTKFTATTLSVWEKVAPPSDADHATNSQRHSQRRASATSATTVTGLADDASARQRPVVALLDTSAAAAQAQAASGPDNRPVAITDAVVAQDYLPKKPLDKRLMKVKPGECVDVVGVNGNWLKCCSSASGGKGLLPMKGVVDGTIIHSSWLAMLTTRTERVVQRAKDDGERKLRDAEEATQRKLREAEEAAEQERQRKAAKLKRSLQKEAVKRLEVKVENKRDALVQVSDKWKSATESAAAKTALAEGERGKWNNLKETVQAQEATVVAEEDGIRSSWDVLEARYAAACTDLGAIVTADVAAVCALEKPPTTFKRIMDCAVLIIHCPLAKVKIDGTTITADAAEAGVQPVILSSWKSSKERLLEPGGGTDGDGTSFAQRLVSSVPLKMGEGGHRMEPTINAETLELMEVYLAQKDFTTESAAAKLAEAQATAEAEAFAAASEAANILKKPAPEESSFVGPESLARLASVCSWVQAVHAFYMAQAPNIKREAAIKPRRKVVNAQNIALRKAAASVSDLERQASECKELEEAAKLERDELQANHDVCASHVTSLIDALVKRVDIEEPSSGEEAGGGPLETAVNLMWDHTDDVRAAQETEVATARAREESKRLREEAELAAASDMITAATADRIAIEAEEMAAAADMIAAATASRLEADAEAAAENWRTLLNDTDRHRSVAAKDFSHKDTQLLDLVIGQEVLISGIKGKFLKVSTAASAGHDIGLSAPEDCSSGLALQRTIVNGALIHTIWTQKNNEDHLSTGPRSKTKASACSTDVVRYLASLPANIIELLPAEQSKAMHFLLLQYESLGLQEKEAKAAARRQTALGVEVPLEEIAAPVFKPRCCVSYRMFPEKEVKGGGRGLKATPGGTRRSRELVFGHAVPLSRRTTTAEVIYGENGAVSVGIELHRLYHPGGAPDINCDSTTSEIKPHKLGTMLAANSGRPAGAVGMNGRVDRRQVRPDHRTQEEDVVCSWLAAETAHQRQQQRQKKQRNQRGQRREEEAKEDEQSDGELWDLLFRDTIDGQWGMKDTKGTGPSTLQGINYMAIMEPQLFADAWAVPSALLCDKRPVEGDDVRDSGVASKEYDPSASYPCSLVFCAGPNAGASGHPTGSTMRTLNTRASVPGEYNFFRECLHAAIAAALDAMIDQGVTVALVAMVSCGIYAGPHKKKINNEFVDLVNEILAEPPLPGLPPRGCYFSRVVIPKLGKARYTPHEKDSDVLTSHRAAADVLVGASIAALERNDEAATVLQQALLEKHRPPKEVEPIDEAKLAALLSALPQKVLAALPAEAINAMTSFADSRAAQPSEQHQVLSAALAIKEVDHEDLRMLQLVLADRLAIIDMGPQGKLLKCRNLRTGLVGLVQAKAIAGGAERLSYWQGRQEEEQRIHESKAAASARKDVLRSEAARLELAPAMYNQVHALFVSLDLSETDRVYRKDVLHEITAIMGGNRDKAKSMLAKLKTAKSRGVQPTDDDNADAVGGVEGGGGYCTIKEWGDFFRSCAKDRVLDLVLSFFQKHLQQIRLHLRKKVAEREVAEQARLVLVAEADERKSRVDRSTTAGQAGFTEEEFAVIANIFSALDKDSSGEFSAEELTEFWGGDTKLGAQLSKVLGCQSGDGSVTRDSWNEFFLGRALDGRVQFNSAVSAWLDCYENGPPNLQRERERQAALDRKLSLVSKLMVTLKMNFARVEEAGREEFDRAFARCVAKSLSVKSEHVSISSVIAGSVVVIMQVQGLTDAAERLAKTGLNTGSLKSINGGVDVDFKVKVKAMAADASPPNMQQNQNAAGISLSGTSNDGPLTDRSAARLSSRLEAHAEVDVWDKANRQWDYVPKPFVLTDEDRMRRVSLETGGSTPAMRHFHGKRKGHTEGAVQLSLSGLENGQNEAMPTGSAILHIRKDGDDGSATTIVMSTATTVVFGSYTAALRSRDWANIPEAYCVSLFCLGGKLSVDLSFTTGYEAMLWFLVLQELLPSVAPDMFMTPAALHWELGRLKVNFDAIHMACTPEDALCRLVRSIPLRDRCAVAMQTQYRGFVARKELARRRHKRKSAVITIAYHMRKYNNKMDAKRSGAATCIIGGFKMVCAKQELARRKQFELETGAATCIIGGFKIINAKQELLRCKQFESKHFSALAIASACRCFLAKQELARRKQANIQHNSATTIACAYKSTQARRELSNRRHTRESAVITIAYHMRKHHNNMDAKRSGAATCIIGGFKMVCAKKELASRKQFELETGAATCIIGGFKMVCAKQELARRKQAQLEYDSATTIACAFKSLQARREMKRLKFERESAGIKILYHMSKHHQKMDVKRDGAATCIIGGFKVVCAKQELARRKQFELETGAATCIIGGFKMVCAKQELARRKQFELEDGAATVLTYAFRCSAARKELERRKREKSAVVIQTNYRGYHGRQSLLKLQMDRKIKVSTMLIIIRMRRFRRRMVEKRSRSASAIASAYRCLVARRERNRRWERGHIFKRTRSYFADGRIDGITVSQFLEMFPKEVASGQEMELRKAFAVVDKDADGMISYNIQEAELSNARLQKARDAEEDRREAKRAATVDRKREAQQVGMKSTDMRNMASIRSANYALFAKGEVGWQNAGRFTVHVVDGAKDEPHKFMYSSLCAALRHAKAGDKILISPGNYNEFRTVTVTKAVSIDALRPQPPGSPPAVTFECANEEMLVWQASGGSIANIAFKLHVNGQGLQEKSDRGSSGASTTSNCSAARFQSYSSSTIQVDNCSFETDGDCAGAPVIVTAGNVKMRKCYFKGLSQNDGPDKGFFGTALVLTGSAIVNLMANDIKGCLAIEGRAQVVMNRNSLTSSSASGLMIMGGQVTLKDDSISGHKLECVNVCDDSVKVSMSNCKIFAGQSVGMSVCAGHAEMANCEVYGHMGPCVLLSGGTLRTSVCNIHSGRSAGVLVMGDGNFLLVDTAMHGNGGSGLDVMSGSPKADKCQVYENCGCGVHICGDCDATVTDCEIRNNGTCAAMLSAGGSATIRGNAISEGKGSALVFSGKGTSGVAEGNTITNFSVGVETTTDANPTVKENSITECAKYGLLLHSGGAGSFDSNTVEQCKEGGIRVESGAAPVLTSNTVRFNQVVGLLVCGNETAGEYTSNQVSNTQGTGIIISDGAKPDMKANILINQNGIGLHLGTGSAGTYSGGRIHCNRGHGVLMDGDTCTTVSGVNISENESPAAILVTDSAQGQLISNIVSKAPHSAIVVSGAKACPVLLRNDVLDSGGVGILIQAQAKGIYQENTVRRSRLAGIEVCEEADPTVRANTVSHSKRNGILIHRGALGQYLENAVGHTHGVGIMLLCGDLLLKANNIHSGQAAGILVSNGARGRLEGNTFSGHRYAAITLSDGADPILTGNHVQNGETVGLLVQRDAGGTLERNRIEGCEGQGIKVTGANSSPMVISNVLSNCGVGIFVSGQSKLATLDSNDITGVNKAGILITDGAAPSVVRNKVHHILSAPGILIDTATSSNSYDSGGDPVKSFVGSESTGDQAVAEALAQLSMELNQQAATVQPVCISDNVVHMATEEGWSVVVKAGSVAQLRCNQLENGFPGGIDEQEGSEVQAKDNEWHGPESDDTTPYKSSAEMAAAAAALKQPVSMDAYIKLIDRSSKVAGAVEQATAVPRKPVQIYNRLNFMQD